MSDSGRAQGRENDFVGLRWIWDFGWLRPQELGLLMWKRSRHRAKYAERLGRKWEAAGLVIARSLPDHSGTAWVLAEKGAELLRARGVDARSGKDWGKTRRGIWIAPKWWRHDLLANSLLATLAAQHYAVVPERRLRRENDVEKLPDGIAVSPKGLVFWIEVESARKTGKRSMQFMAEALIRVAAGKAPLLSSLKATTFLVAYKDDARDDRGHQINHDVRVINAIHRLTRTDVIARLMAIETKGPAVATWKSKYVWIRSSIVTQRLQMWQTRLSLEKDPNLPNRKGYFVAGIRVKYWKQADNSWEWEVVDECHSNPSGSRYNESAPTAKVLAKGAAPNAEAACRAMAGLPIWDDEGWPAGRTEW